MTFPEQEADTQPEASNPKSQTSSTYAAAGVDIDAGNRAVKLMKEDVRSTFTGNVFSDVGSFGGQFSLNELPPQPLLVASTDGIGTKVKLAAKHNRWKSIGHDVVNHCLNDILVQGAHPLFFLDYIAADKLVPEDAAEIVFGMAEACRDADCALLGGETAEMPSVYTAGSYDVVGTIVGIVDRQGLLPRPHDMQPGDVLFGFPSSGPHTNGYSLIRRIVKDLDLQQPLEDSAPLLDALLAPHRSYLPEVRSLEEARIFPKGLAHITGGGLVDNVPRILPSNLRAQIDRRLWDVPLLFRRLLAWSEMEPDEAYRVFNMGIGMVVVVAAEQASLIPNALPDAIQIGELDASDQADPEVVFEG